jgi:hypothetical protein
MAESSRAESDTATPLGKPPDRTQHTSWAKSLCICVGLTIVVGIILLAFTWPIVTLSPHSVPVAVVGPEALGAQVQGALPPQVGDVLAVQPMADRDAAVAAIERREIYGAIVLAPSPQVLSSSAASTATHQMLTQLAGQLAAQLPTTTGVPPVVPVTDVVPLVSGDERGVGIAASALPLVFGGIIGGIGSSLVVVGVWRRIVAVTGYSILAGFAIAAVMQGWYGVLQGSYVTNAAAFALTLLAQGAFIVGIVSLGGKRAIAAGVVLFLLIGNPISGAQFPKEFITGPWGDVGQWFPPGAGATLLRNLSYFPAASTVFPWLLLAGWAVLGLLFAVIGLVKHGVIVSDGGTRLDTAPDAA